MVPTNHAAPGISHFRKAEMCSSLCVSFTWWVVPAWVQHALEYSSCHCKCACHWGETLIAFAGWQQCSAQVCVWGPSACKWDLELCRHCLLVGNNWSTGSTLEVHLLSPTTVLDSFWVSDWLAVSNKWQAPDLEPSFPNTSPLHKDIQKLRWSNQDCFYSPLSST